MNALSLTVGHNHALHRKLFVEKTNASSVTRKSVIPRKNCHLNLQLVMSNTNFYR